MLGPRAFVATLCDGHGSDLGWCMDNSLYNGKDVIWQPDSQMPGFCNGNNCANVYNYSKGQLLQMNFRSVTGVPGCSTLSSWDECGALYDIGANVKNTSDPECSTYNYAVFWSWWSNAGNCSLFFEPTERIPGLITDKCPCSTTDTNFGMQYMADTNKMMRNWDMDMQGVGWPAVSTPAGSITNGVAWSLGQTPQCPGLSGPFAPSEPPVSYTPIVQYVPYSNAQTAGECVQQLPPQFLYVPYATPPDDRTCLCTQPYASITIPAVTPGMFGTDRKSVCDSMVGYLPECPSTLGDGRACVFTPAPPQTDPDLAPAVGMAADAYARVPQLGGCILSGPTGGGIDSWGSGFVGYHCAKTKWDDQMTAPCCLGMLPTAPDGAPDGMSELYRRQRLCHPSWCISDPTGQCATNPDFLATCSAFTGDPGSRVPNLLNPQHPCNQWYKLQLENLDSLGWQGVDGIVRDFCTQYPDEPACQCVALQPPDSCDAGASPNTGCIPYTSLSSGSGAGSGAGCPTNAFQVQLSAPVGDSGMFRPINLTDAVCLNSRCAALDGSVFLTNDMARRASMCPDVCMQIQIDQCLTAGEITARGVHIDDQVAVCSGASGTITAAKPMPWMPDDLYLEVPHNPNQPGEAGFGQVVVVANVAPTAGASAFSAGSSWTNNLHNVLALAPVSPATISVLPGEETTVMIQLADGVSSQDAYSVGPFVATLSFADAQNGVSAQTRVHVNPFLTEAPQAPLCDPSVCQQPVYPPGQDPVVTVQTSPNAWAWVSLAVAGLALLAVIAFVVARRVRRTTM